MLGGSQGLTGTNGQPRTGQLAWPLATTQVPTGFTTTSDGFSKYGFYSLFPGGPTFGSALYSHSTVGTRFAPAGASTTTTTTLQPTAGGAGTAFHTAHKVSDSLFSATGYTTFGAPTPPPGSPYSPVPAVAAQLELLAKGYATATTNTSNIIIHQTADYAKKLALPSDKMHSSAHHPKLLGGEDHHQHHHLMAMTQPQATASPFGRAGEWTMAAPATIVKKEPDATTLVLSSDASTDHAIIKVEMTSPVQKTTTTTTTHHHHHHHTHHQEQHHHLTMAAAPTGANGLPSIVTANGNIPVGIAVGRQRIQQQEVAPTGILTTTHFKEVARISEIGDAGLPNCPTTSLLHCTAATTSLDDSQLHHHHHQQQHFQQQQQQHLHHQHTQQQHHQQQRAFASWAALSSGPATLQPATPTPTLWQYPGTLPVELPMSAVPLPSTVGLQLIREPTSGGLLLLPTTGMEAVQQAVLWPSYSAPSPHLILPPSAPSMSAAQASSAPMALPPPLQLLSATNHSTTADYQTGNGTHHHHHQSTSTRLVAVTTTTSAEQLAGATVDGGYMKQHHHHQPQRHHKILPATMIKIEPGEANAGTIITTLDAASSNRAIGTSPMYEHNPLQVIYHQHQPPQTSEAAASTMISTTSQMQMKSIEMPMATATTTTTTTCQSLGMSTGLACLTPPPDSMNTSALIGPLTTEPATTEDEDEDDEEDDDDEDDEVQEDECQDEINPDNQVVALEQSVASEKQVQDASNQTESIAESDEEPALPTAVSDLPESSAVLDTKPVIVDQQILLPVIEETIETSESVLEPAQEPEPLTETAVPEPVVAKTEPADDFSGLQLLSNSILEHECTATVAASDSVLDETIETKTEETGEICDDDIKDSSTPKADDSFGGLNLLCALAEQRIMEEETIRGGCAGGRTPKRKKEKRKHHHHHRHRCHHCATEPSAKKCKLEEPACSNCSCHRSCKSSSKAMAEPAFCCRSGRHSSCAGVLNDSERDMRQQLADLQRKYREKQRELKKLKPCAKACSGECMRKKHHHHHRCRRERVSTSSADSLEQGEGTPVDVDAEPVEEATVTLVETVPLKDEPVEPSVVGAADSTTLPVLKRRRSSSSSTSTNADRKDEPSKRLKKTNLVEYLLAAKQKLIQMPSFSDSPPRFVEDTQEAKRSRIRPKLKAETRTVDDDDEQEHVKQVEEVEVEPDHDGTKDSGIESKLDLDVEDEIVETVVELNDVVKDDDDVVVEKPTEDTEKEEEIPRPATPVTAVNRCALTPELLETHQLRVLLANKGLFYAGVLNAVEPPDLYSLTLDGERGNRRHILCREQIIEDAIVEVPVTSIDELVLGTRLCAYWSQQYRCLYPGTVSEPLSPCDKKFVAVEFDDGDSGTIALEDIRLLPPDYPLSEYDPNPLLSLSKRRRRLSTVEERKPSNSGVSPAHLAATSAQHKSVHKQNKDLIADKTAALTTNPESAIPVVPIPPPIKKDRDSKERKRLKKRKRDKNCSESGGSSSNGNKKKKRKHKCTGENCKHRRHKKHRKHHRKHHHSNNDDEGASTPEKDEETPEQDNDDEVEDEPEQADVLAESEQRQDEYHIVPNPEDEVTLDDIVDGTDSKKSKKLRDRQESCESRSKISAFLPARQLWSWSGKGYKRPRGKGRSKKEFFKAIQRGKETMTVGDSAVFLSTGRPDRPYIGKIEAMWETCGTMVVKVKWFYHPEETNGCPLNLKYPGALFESPHVDENDVQTISHKCRVVPLLEYTEHFGTDPRRYASIYDNNDIYYLAGYYDPTASHLTMNDNIPLED